MASKTLVLIDGSSYLFRAYHALPPLTNSKDFPTGAIHGVAAMLRKIVRERSPDYIGVVFDPPGKTFRDDIYPQYKANRPPTPEDLKCQIAPLHDLVRAMGLPLLAIPGYEADDVIGTLARLATEAGIDTVISTNDKDMAQLVDEHVTIVNSMDERVLDPAGVEAKFGIPPERIIDYLALIGDTVDNIPGVSKVGPKTAVKWLQQYGSLDDIIAAADDIPGKVGENLRGCLDQFDTTRALLQIKLDVPEVPAPDSLAPTDPVREQLRSIYSELEFRSWLNELLDEEADTGVATGEPAAEAPALDHDLVLDEAVFQAWVERLEAAGEFAFDTETTSLDYMAAEVVGVSFAVEAGHAAYVPFGHDYVGAPQQLSRETVLGRLQPLLEDARIGKLGHNLKYDANVLVNHGIALRGIRYDTMLESYVLDSTASRHDLDSLALKYLGHRTIHFEDVAGKGAKQITFNQVALEEAAPYAAEDADVVLRLHALLWPRLEAEPGLQALLREIELPLVEVLSRMERNGVRIDRDMLAAQGAELAKRIEQVQAEAHKEAGEPFNLASPKQIQKILYEDLGLPVVEKTPKGQPSTAESVLAELAHDYPLPRLILEHRGLSKLKSTYIDKLPQMISERDGRLHTSYHQAVAATGRLSSSDPNLQNIPVRTEEGRRIRKAFVAEPGNILLAADYSQIELRIMAHLSGDEGLLAAFAAGEDIHRATAAEVFGTALKEVSVEQRRAAKAINFGLIYGMSAFGLGRQLGIERGEAQEYVDRYFARYPGVKAFMDNTREQARARGYVETVFQRRLYLPEIKARNAARRQYAERTAINAPMQGTAADIIKRAMINVDRWLAEAGNGARLIMQVHDELVLEVPAADADVVAERLRSIMEAAASLRVPLVVDVGRGSNWEEAH